MGERLDLSDFPLILTIPLLWGDQDSFGHVNNIVYLRWCETARVEYLMRIGLWPELPPKGAGPILASISCDFERALTHPDTVKVGARITRIGNSSFDMEHLIVSVNTGVVAAEARSTMVLLDYSRNQPVPVPIEMREVIARLEGKSFAVGTNRS